MKILKKVLGFAFGFSMLVGVQKVDASLILRPLGRVARIYALANLARSLLDNKENIGNALGEPFEAQKSLGVFLNVLSDYFLNVQNDFKVGRSFYNNYNKDQSIILQLINARLNVLGSNGVDLKRIGVSMVPDQD